MVAALLGAIALVPLAVTSASADVHYDGVIDANTTLSPGELVTSEGGNAVLAMQGDGNLVLYSLPTWTPVWATGTYDPGASVTMQGDGNLVMYNVSGGAIWDTATGSGGSFLKVQDDLKLVMYRPNLSVAWETYGPMMNIEFARRLDRVLHDLRVAGYNPSVRSAYRTFDEQQALYDSCAGTCTNARGGYSWHNYGVAADVEAPGKGFTSTYARIAEGYGLTWGGRFRSLYDPAHVELHPASVSFAELIRISNNCTDLRPAWDRLNLP
jgi:hypothetical protein